MPVKSRGLALLTVTGFAVTLTACSSGGTISSSAAAGQTSAAVTTSASETASGAPAPNDTSVAESSSAAASGSASGSSPAAVPSGYSRVGGTAQGISVAVPASWTAVDLSKESPSAAAKKLNVPGITSSELSTDMTQLQKVHAIFVADTASATSSAGHFARNLNAYCDASDVSESGSAGVPLLKTGAQTELSSIATDVKEADETVGGIPGVVITYEVVSSTVGTLYGSQLAVLPKADKACYVTLTATTPQTSTGILAAAAASAQFP